jgi:hypothetical protein
MDDIVYKIASIGDLLSHSLFNECIKRVGTDLMRNHDEIIKNAFVSKNLSITEDFITKNVSKIQRDGDRFEHIWYHFDQPDAIRIISIEKDIKLTYAEENGVWKVRAEQAYY